MSNMISGISNTKSCTYIYIIQGILLTLVLYLFFKFYKKTSNRNLPPGPYGLPLVGYLPFLGKKPYKTLAELGKIYGDIISLRLGPKLVVILNEFEVLKDTLSHPAALDRSPGIFDHIPRTSFLTANGIEWNEQRRYALRATRDLGLGKRGWENLVQEEVLSFIEDLTLLKGKASDISYNLLAALSNSILTILIGRKLKNGPDDKEFKTMMNFAKYTLIYTGPSYLSSLMPNVRRCLEFFGILGYDIAAEMIAKFSKIIRDEIKRCQNDQDSNEVNIIQMYTERKKEMDLKKDPHFYTDDNIEGLINVYFLGGTDTLYSSLGWLFRLMAAYPEIQRKVQRELDDIAGHEGKISYEERFRIPYTMAVLMEGQRFSSFVPLSTTRRANHDFQIQGYTIPAGTDIIGNTWAIHNDPRYWTNPEKFTPERFLKDDGKTVITNIPSFLPFSVGRRNCPGETAAWMSILLFFTSVMQKFVITTENDTKPNFDVIEGLVSHLKPQLLCFKERL